MTITKPTHHALIATFSASFVLQWSWATKSLRGKLCDSFDPAPARPL